jgi:hypothetical protein
MLMIMDYLSSHNVAGAISIICLLALGSAVTVGELTDNEEEETDDSEDESFVSWLWGFWLLCFLGIVVILMRLVRDHINLLYRASMGLIALAVLLDVANCIAKNQVFTYFFIVDLIALWHYVYELRRRQSCLAAWYCAAQMWCMCAFLSLVLLVLMIDLILEKEPLDACDWISLNAVAICTVSNFVVTMAPTPVAQEQQSDVSGDGKDFMQHLLI